MPDLVSFTKSDRSNKKYVLRFLNPKFSIHFGSKNSSVFLDHKDETKKKNYIKRHQALNEDWDSITPASASRWLLWSGSDLEENLKMYMKKFNIEDRRKRR